MNSVRSTRDIIIQTTALPKARAFYAGVLCFQAICDEPQLLGVETGAIRLFLEPGPSKTPVLEFLADDMAAEKAKLLAAGCAVVEEDATIPRCYLRDPFGLIFNLGQR